AIFPFDAERALVAHAVQLADDLFEVDGAAAWAAEVPTAAGVAEVDVARQDAAAAVECDDRVFHVHVINAVRERADKLDRVDALPVQMARVEVEAELGPVVESFEGPLGGVDIERDLGR